MKPRTREALAALVALGTIIGLAVGGAWPFYGDPVTESEVRNPSLMQFLLGDRIMLGIVRLLILALATFAILSLAAFLVRGRWLKGLSTRGWDVDERQETSRAITDLEAQLDQVTYERDEALQELEDLVTQGQETIEEAGAGVGAPAYNGGDDTPEGTNSQAGRPAEHSGETTPHPRTSGEAH